jgi:hypothetical protein
MIITQGFVSDLIITRGYGFLRIVRREVLRFKSVLVKSIVGKSIIGRKK